ncbi:hypothetical protein VTH82DRAFT_8449 [Thermothelomyces myriococcoides]
MSINRAGSNL